jgi:peptidoglycan-associated lipoprotein
MGGAKKEEAAEKPAATVEDRGAGAEARGAQAGAGFQGHPLDNPDSLLSSRVVYFDFDSSTIKEEARAVIEAHAQYLAAHASATVTLEGHADERGTREYNIALGERRAKAVGELLTLQGANAGQLEVISYGEERPAALGHNEEAWRLNRRVEIIYKTR